MGRRESRVMVVLAAAAALLLAAYLLGYLAGSEFQIGRPDAPSYRQRSFGREWQCFVYRPAAWAESILTGEPVETSYYVGEHRYHQYDVFGDPQYRVRGGEFAPGSSSP